MKGLYYVRVREAVGRGKRRWKVGRMGGELFLGGGGGGKGMIFCGLGSERKRRELGEWDCIG